MTQAVTSTRKSKSPSQTSKRTSGTGAGIHVARHYTTAGIDPLDQVSWDRRSTVIRVGEHLLVVTEQGELWVVEASAKAFNVIHREQIMRSGHRAHLAYSNGILYARDGKQLVAVQVFE
jgi:hypothetical protein